MFLTFPPVYKAMVAKDQGLQKNGTGRVILKRHI
jgi:hypothetical protein